MDMLGKYPLPEDTYKKFEALLSSHVNKYNKGDKLFFIGYNAKFDSDFVRQFMSLNNNKYYGSYFWNPYIDLMTIAASQLMNERDSMPDFKLATVARMLGLDVDNERLHDAEYDIYITMRIYSRLLQKPMFDTSILGS